MKPHPAVSWLSLPFTLALLGGCSPQPPPEVGTNAPRTPPATVIDPQLQALDKARAAQKQVDDQAKATREAIERAGG